MINLREQFRSLIQRLTYGLARRLMIVLSSIILLCACAVLTISVVVQKRMIEDRLYLNALHLSSLIKEIATPALLRDDPASIEFFFEELEKRDDILSAAIVDAQGFLWMGHDADGSSWLTAVSNPCLDVAIATGEPHHTLTDDHLQRSGPIIVADEIIGFLSLRVARAPIAEELRGLWVSTAAIALACLIIGPVLALLVARRLSEPLSELETASRRVASGDFEHRITSNSNDEFDVVARSFNDMLDELNQSFLQTQRVAFEDKLTAIPNRSWLNNQIDTMVDASRTNTSFALLFLDVDRFKEVNDTHGHHIGDLLLRGFTQRVHRCLDNLGQRSVGVRMQKRSAPDVGKGEALFARLGGDEFTILIHHDLAEEAAQAIVEAMVKPFRLDGLSLPVSTSVGIAHYPCHATTREHLLKCADVAMYQAKNTARGSFALYDEAKHRELKARTQLEQDIQEALDNRQFDLFLQPKFDVATNTVTGAEALIRWNHHKRGNVPPDAFLPVAAQMGLMPLIGELMLEKAIKAAACLNADRDRSLSVAVNITSEDLMRPCFSEKVERLLQAHNLDAELLEVEITEGTAMEQNDLVEHNIDLLRELGVSLAIDDFGVGYSNLGRLKSMAFDTLKIDRSLIQDITEETSSQELFSTILDMAAVLKAQVVSEGVETEEQLAFLAKLGVKTYQGYLGARPMHVDDFAQWLEGQGTEKTSMPVEVRRAS